MADITLTQKDIDELTQNMSSKTKSEAIKKVGYYYNDTILTDNERKIAEDIFRIMVVDAEEQVRSILADSLKSSKRIPRDIIQKIVNDKDNIALPFIRQATSLTDEDLVDILNSQNIDRQKAVAMREQISSSLSQYIAEKCPEPVIETLLENEKASIAEKTYNVIVDKYPESEKIKEKIVDRKQLPVAIMERIVNSLSEVLQKKLLISHSLPTNLVTDIIEQVKDKATLRISQEYSSDAQIDALVRQLYKMQRLTPNLVVRAICMGDLKFFEFALLYITRRKLTDIRKIVVNLKDEFMIRNVLRDANIPTNLFPAVITSLKIIQEMNFDVEKENKANFTQKVIERLLTFDTTVEKMDSDDVDYLISKIS